MRVRIPLPLVSEAAVERDGRRHGAGEPTLHWQIQPTGGRINNPACEHNQRLIDILIFTLSSSEIALTPFVLVVVLIFVKLTLLVPGTTYFAVSIFWPY